MFRGYFINNRGDEITHIGWIVDILNTGHIGSTNIYPISHILTTEISLISGIDFKTGINFIPVCFYVLYALGLILLSRNIANRHGQTYLILAFGSVLLFTYFNYMFLPTQHILFVLPLILYLFNKSSLPDSLSYGVCLVILSLSLPFLHPLGTLLICAILIIINISAFISRKLPKSERQPSEPFSQIRNWTPIIIIFVVFSLWFSSFSMFDSSARLAYSSIIGPESKTPIVDIVNGMNEIHYSLFDTFLRLIKNNGQDIFFLFLGGVAVLFLLKRYFFERKSITAVEIFFAFFFVLLTLFAISTILSSFLGTGVSLRVFCWPLAASVILNGLVYQQWIFHLSRWIRSIALCTVLIIILVSTIIGVFNTYYSPIIDSGDVQVTRSEWQSMEWFLSYKGPFRTFIFDQLPERAPDAFYGVDSPKPSSTGYFYSIPVHLGYEENSRPGNILPGDDYLVIDEGARVVKKMLHPTVGAYTAEEMDRVYSDKDFSFIYSSGGTDIAFINGSVAYQ